MVPPPTIPVALRGPLVHIFIANATSGRFLERAIESALGQLDVNVDVYVVHDSTSAEIAAAADRFLDDARVHVVRTTSGGRAHAYNRAWRRLRATRPVPDEREFVLLLDGDDFLTSGDVARIVAGTDGHHPGQLVAVHYRTVLVDDTDTRVGVDPPPGVRVAGRGAREGPVRPNALSFSEKGGLFSRRFVDEVFPLPEVEADDVPERVLTTVAPAHGDACELDAAYTSCRVGRSWRWRLDRDIPLEWLRRRDRHDDEVQRAVADVAGRHGLDLPVAGPDDDPLNVLARLGLLRLDPAVGDVRNESRRTLLHIGLRAVRDDPSLRISERLRLRALLLGIALGPPSTAHSFVRRGFAPRGRHPLLRRVILIVLAMLIGVVIGSVFLVRAEGWTTLRVDVGSTAAWTDAEGTTWSADTTSSRFRVNGVRASVPDDLGATRSERWATTRLTVLDVPQGNYELRLHFEELLHDAPQRRVFSVEAEGRAVITDQDTWSEAGGIDTPLVRSIPLDVTDGTLDVVFRARRAHAHLDKFELVLVSSDTSTTSTLPTDPAAVDFTPTSGRPFRNDSPWNTPIPADPVLDPKSASIVSWMTANPRSINAAYDEYGHPVYDANLPGLPPTPTVTVDCLNNWGVCKLEQQPVPVPTDAAPSPGGDATMVVVDWASMRSFDFWRAEKVSSTFWTTSWGTVTDLTSSGATGGGTTGAGAPRLAGLPRVREIRAGIIDHALHFGTTNACASVFRYPATKTDGWSTAADCIPEGARVQLDPTIDVDAIPGITKAEKAVAKAMQTYGAYVVDNAGSNMGFGFERIDPADLLPGECATPGATCNPYVAAGLPWDYYHMPNIPWTRIRVLNSWDGS